MESGIINDVDLILGEGHKFCDEDFGEKLEKLGFKLIKRGFYDEMVSLIKDLLSIALFSFYYKNDDILLIISPIPIFKMY